MGTPTVLFGTVAQNSFIPSTGPSFSFVQLHTNDQIYPMNRVVFYSISFDSFLYLKKLFSNLLVYGWWGCFFINANHVNFASPRSSFQLQRKSNQKQEQVVVGRNYQLVLSPFLEVHNQIEINVFS